IGRSENAVRIQIAVALIAFVLLHLLHKMTKAQQGFLELVRLVRANLKTPPACVRSNPRRKSTPVNWTSTGEIHEPDSRGVDPAIHLSEMAVLFKDGYAGQARV
ncbi:MAG: hypothetical protein ACXW3X_12885, partial [Rhodoplanes sp.]